jgi:hypothetical protein
MQCNVVAILRLCVFQSRDNLRGEYEHMILHLLDMTLLLFDEKDTVLKGTREDLDHGFVNVAAFFPSIHHPTYPIERFGISRIQPPKCTCSGIQLTLLCCPIAARPIPNVRYSHIKTHNSYTFTSCNQALELYNAPFLPLILSALRSGGPIIGPAFGGAPKKETFQKDL